MIPKYEYLGNVTTGHNFLAGNPRFLAGLCRTRYGNNEILLLMTFKSIDTAIHSLWIFDSCLLNTFSYIQRGNIPTAIGSSQVHSSRSDPIRHGIFLLVFLQLAGPDASGSDNPVQARPSVPHVCRLCLSPPPRTPRLHITSLSPASFPLAHAAGRKDGSWRLIRTTKIQGFRFYLRTEKEKKEKETNGRAEVSFPLSPFPKFVTAYAICNTP